jgi:hypothetical protein
VTDAHQVVGGLKNNKQGMSGGSGWPNHCYLGSSNLMESNKNDADPACSSFLPPYLWFT